MLTENRPSDHAAGISRRSFLKGASGIGLFAAAGGAPLLDFFVREAGAESAALVHRWVSSTCQGCTTWCPVQVKIVDGRAVHLRGNPHSLANHGKMCPRPNIALQQVYDPDRVKVPMRRTNPRKGRDEDPGFVPISWDEAMGLIADKMMELRENEETHKFTVFRGRYSYMRDVIYSAVPKIFGSPNGISHSAICAEAEKFGAFFTEGFWDYRDYDLEHTRYVLCWGADPLSSNRQVPHAINIWGHVRDRAQIAVIDPRLSATAAKANEWLPVLPGEDGALAVAIAHVILTEGVWSREFVGDFSDGTNRFIAGEAVDESLFEEIHTNGVVKWWNLELQERTPEWAETQCGIPADQIRRVALGFADAAPAAISWVSPGAAMQARGGYAAMAAHALNGLVGSSDHRGGTVQKTKVPQDKIPAYSDYQDALAKKLSKKPKMDQRGTLAFPAMNKGKSGGGVVTNNAADAILQDDPYDIKVAIAYWANFTFSCGGSDRWERALTKLPFFVHVTTNPSEMSHFADIVLPAAHQLFEKWSFLKSKQNLHGYASLTQPMIKPLWDVRQDETEVPYLLAEALAERGFDNMLRYFREAYADPETGQHPTSSAEFALTATKMLTRPCWDASHKDYGKYGDRLEGWDDFVTKGVWNSHRYEYQKKWGKYATVTGRFEFYSETLKKALTAHAEKHEVSVDEVLTATNYTVTGEQAFVPHFEPALRWGDEKEFPLIFFEHRSRLNREGRSANCTWYQAHKNVDPGDENWDDVLKMNPVDARRFGLQDREMVRVASPTGEITVRLKLWEGVRPGTVAKCYGQGHWAYGRVAASDFQRRIPRGGNNNVILPAEYERLSGSTARHGGVTRVKVARA
ncbi:MAG: molybdopterin-dependent oxidoreductase [Gemmatimonadetes bacterium]|jgi:anaerobic selenocysteine-containing dehydrogenase|nr:molybdopterin-dependent oxidoreductase [Gemmatimonadota bacterium]MBT4612152.1 molybdopterin-dependent oxidoreductase [Gemmatimonadota bacterium]MBT5060586.1 molybdopterin-dependent oxidoreductase [Gemmatimonadota bacterium]MBT5146247.1 molybdopterin-dependent oxidoreductase [Gemmatimonadota bacterium]MBT5588407.1 molybdopterin-dependent oxidoreductase [Gemmatimonadota bacterium]